MKQFVPFEDEWEALDRLGPACLIPFHVDVPCAHRLREHEEEQPVSPAIDDAGRRAGLAA